MHCDYKCQRIHISCRTNILTLVKIGETINVLLGAAYKAPSHAECAALPEPHRRFSWCQSGATAIDRSPNEHVLLLATLFLFAVLHLLSVCPINTYPLRPAQGRARVNVCLFDRKDLAFYLPRVFVPGSTASLHSRDAEVLDRQREAWLGEGELQARVVA